MISACGIVVATARGLGEGIVCIVNLLEFAGAFCALWGICGDTVGMSL